MDEEADAPRRIDRLRDGAGSIDIRTPGDDSAVVGLIPTADRMLVVKGQGIYEIKLADQVDPDRTYIDTPNTIQQVLAYGADEPWVGSVLLTAHYFLLGPRPPKGVDCAEAFDRVLEVAADLAGAHDLASAFHIAEETAIEESETKIRSDRSRFVPAIGNVEPRCNEFLQRGHHALRGLFRLARKFYPDLGAGGWPSFAKKIDSDPKSGDNFAEVLAGVLPFLQLIRNARDCVEHPRPEQKLVVTDFSLDSRSVLHPPTIAVVHPRTPRDSLPVREFFAESLETVVYFAELMLVSLSARRARPVGGLPVHVIELPPERRKYPHVRYGYGAILNGDVVPVL